MEQQLKIEHFTSNELRLLLADNENFSRSVCLFACYQISIGMRPEEVASFYGTSVIVVCNWVKRLNEGGIEELTANEIPGKIKIWKEDKRLSFMEIMKYRQPADYGFNNNSWSLMHLIKLFLHEYQVSYRLTQLHHFFVNRRRD